MSVWKDETQSDTNRLEAIDRLVMNIYYKADPDSALYYAEIQIAYAKERNNSKWLSKALSNKARLLVRSGTYSQAMEAYREALQFQKGINDIKRMADSYQWLGYLMRKEGKFTEALENYQLSLDLSGQLGEEGVSFHAATLNSMGTLFMDQQDYENALEYYHKSLELHQAIDRKIGIAANYNNISQVYLNQGIYDKARPYLEKSLELKKELNDLEGIGNVYQSFGSIAFEEGNYDAALRYYQVAFRYRDSISHRGDMAASSGAIGRTYLKMGAPANATDWCRKGLRQAEEVGDVNEAILNCRCLYETYRQLGRADSALIYHEKLMVLQDSIFNEETTRQLAQLEAQYAYEKEKTLLESELRQQRLIRNAMIGVGGLLLLLIYLIYRISRIRAKKNRELEFKNQQIEEDRATISQQAAELRELDAMKSRFFANISHELRTPVTLIATPLAHALEQHQNTLSQELKRILTLARRNAGKLINLIEELLELSRIETGQLELAKTPTQLAPFFRQLMSAYESTAAVKGVELSIDCQLAEEEAALLDKGRVSKIVNNLLSNALKFTPKEGRVNCEVGRRKAEGGTHKPTDINVSEFAFPTSDFLQVAVADTGRGISPEDLPYVFDRYFQTKQKGLPTEGGMGIGLALSKELAELMNGSLSVESTAGKGSTFTLRLPLEMAEESPTAPPALLTAAPAASVQPDKAVAAVREEGQKHLLIVEDNPDMQQLLTGLLSGQYHCTLANNGAEAWAMLNDGTFSADDVDLILSDVMMPEMDGYELLERIKAHKQWRQAPVVLLTARAAEEGKLKALRLGVDDYLIKPFSSVELTARIENLIANYEQRQELKRLGVELDLDPAPSSDEIWLSEVEALCLKAIEKQLTINNAYLTGGLNISERQLLRRIKALTGLSVNKYVQEVKLQNARHLLEYQAYPTVAQVAYACGFNTPAYFSSVFQKRFGKRPADYFSSEE
ncbi:MAG: tetratricopeptide repeat protein [Phaeodactylibacter sp.]|nr:tetratricopeptide repeat protein [Phaeodactylibacter sp.]